jgi:hypothetical protein
VVTKYIISLSYVTFKWNIEIGLQMYLVTTCLMSPYFNVPLEGHIRQAKDVFSDHLSDATLFQCSIGRSHKTD